MMYRPIRCSILKLLFIWCAAISGCANSAPTATYSVWADASTDSQNALFLDFKYFYRSTILFAMPDYQVRQGLKVNGPSIYGPMAIGTALYAKWIDKDTGKIYEDTADLTNRLSGNMSGKTVFFMVKGAQLYIYVISEQKREEGTASMGPSYFRNHYISEIYPVQIEDQPVKGDGK